MEAAPDSAGANSRPKLPKGGDGNGEDFVQAGNGQQTCRQVQRGRPSRRRGLQSAHSHDRPGRQAPANAGAESPLGARLAPRQAPSVIGAFPRRALFDFQVALPEGGVQDARAGMCAQLVRPQLGRKNHSSQERKLPAAEAVGERAPCTPPSAASRESPWR